MPAGYACDTDDGSAKCDRSTPTISKDWKGLSIKDYIRALKHGEHIQRKAIRSIERRLQAIERCLGIEPCDTEEDEPEADIAFTD